MVEGSRQTQIDRSFNAENPEEVSLPQELGNFFREVPAPGAKVLMFADHGGRGGQEDCVLACLGYPTTIMVNDGARKSDAGATASRLVAEWIPQIIKRNPSLIDLDDMDLCYDVTPDRMIETVQKMLLAKIEGGQTLVTTVSVLLQDPSKRYILAFGVGDTEVHTFMKNQTTKKLSTEQTQWDTGKLNGFVGVGRVGQSVAPWASVLNRDSVSFTLQFTDGARNLFENAIQIDGIEFNYEQLSIVDYARNLFIQDVSPEEIGTRIATILAETAKAARENKFWNYKPDNASFALTIFN